MLGLLLIYFIGKTFYTLAGNYDKNQWAFAILGVITYYTGTFIGGICIGLYYEVYLSTPFEELGNFKLGLITLPIGLLFCWGLYIVLKKKWSKKTIEGDNGMLDNEFLK